MKNDKEKGKQNYTKKFEINKDNWKMWNYTNELIGKTPKKALGWVEL